MVPQTKVFVGSLPPGSKPQELRRLFERFGIVTECDIMNRCGFVHMQTEEMASDAIKALDNSSFNGAVITVERGRIKDRNSRGATGGRMGNGGPGRGGARNGVGGGGMRGDMRGDMRGGDMGPRGMGGPRGGGLDGGSRGPPRGLGGGGGGPMRSSMAGGGLSGRSAPYMRDDRRPLGGGFDRGLDRPPMGRDLGYGDDGRYAEDRRGFALVDDRRMGGGGGYNDSYGMYPEDRSPAPMYDDMLMERRGGAGMGSMGGLGPRAALGGGYDRPVQGPPMGNGAGSMFTRRPSPPMRSAGGFDRGDRGGGYNQRFPPMGGR